VRDSAPRYYTEAVEICESQAQIEAHEVCTVTLRHIVGSQENINLGENIETGVQIRVEYR